MGANRKYTKEFLEPIVRESCSVADVLRKMGKKISGSLTTHLWKTIRLLEIDTSHFNIPTSYLRNGGPPRPWQEVLVQRKGVNREKAYVLRRALVDSGRSYACENPECPIKGTWLGKELRLQVNHKNGDPTDCRPENVEFLCPNCHSQTDNHSGSKGKTKLFSRSSGYIRKPPRPKFKKEPKRCGCGAEIKRDSDFCITCAQRLSRKVERPPYEQLLQDVEEMSMLAVGRKYGVSDNAVRKWLKYYKQS